jgi:hypothetical protein
VAPKHSKITRRNSPAPRKRLQERGQQRIEAWIPDVQSPEFAAEGHRQSLAVARSRGEKDDQAFIDSIAEEVLSEFLDE